MPLFSLDEFAGNVWRSVHEAAYRNPSIARTFFTLQGDDLHSITIKRYEPSARYRKIISGRDIYTELSGASVAELVEETRDTHFMASSFAMVGTARDDCAGQRLLDLIVAVEREGDTIFGAVYRQEEFYSGYIDLEDVPKFALSEARILRDYLRGRLPQIIARNWPGVGVIPVDEMLKY